MNEMTSPRIENRRDAERFLDMRIGSGVRPGLDRITGLLGFMDNPQRSYPSIHIAGTNGKTTVSRMVQQILGSHGLATGGFTSPHLARVEERFSVHGVSLDSHDFTDAVRDIAWFVVGYEDSAGEQVTYFEVTAALAFSVFATAAVDVAVVEVGLGGRLDATNVIEAAVSVVTGIAIDHTEFLGDTLELIATEKVAILKQNGTLVTGPLPPEALDPIERRVADTNANWIKFDDAFTVTDATLGVGGWHLSVNGVFGEYSDLFLPLHGGHQVEHLATAIASAEMLLGRPLDNDLLQVAVAATTAPGRLEVISRRPLVLLDGAHNQQGFEGLAATLDTEFPTLAWNLVIGARGERSVESLVEPLKGLVGEVFACAADDPSSISPANVATAAGKTLGAPAKSYENVAVALAAAQSAAGDDGGIVVAGSLYVVGEVRGTIVSVDDRSSEAHLRFDSAISEADEQEFDETDDVSDE